MRRDFSALPRAAVTIEAGETRGRLEWWRHTLGHGGINSRPLPAGVVAGVRELRPRLIRVFLQECFEIYRGGGRFDWSRLDPYMEALGGTGARLVAAITIKPKALFPKVDQAIWRPRDWREWQQVVERLVQRYSVERRLVTHWEVGNETDIGESGGCPYLIPDPRDYGEYYRETVEAVLRVFPGAKVGGPAACWVENEPLPGWVEQCRKDGARLDFVSWHLYDDNPERHASGVEQAKRLLAGFGERRPEMMVTEWNQGFEKASIEEQAFSPRRAASAAACLLAMLEAGLDWSFYYHIRDQTFYREEFAPFFSEQGLAGMERHWNEAPHRFGLFGVGGEVRPQYFVYRMLGEMGEERVAAGCAGPELRVLAGKGEGRVSGLLVNYAPGGTEDRLAEVKFEGLAGGRKALVTRRVDEGWRGRAERLELAPSERREVCTGRQFACQVYCPADSVTQVVLEDAGEPARGG